MSVSGVVAGVSPDWRGSALAVATVATDTVLSVLDAADFDEDGGWLVVADVDTPVEYLSVDEDADTVTLAAAIGAVYDAAEPVVVWDPTVEGGGARVREDIAEVMLPDAEQPVLAVVKHEQVPTAGIYSLVGATVLLEDEDGDDATTDWFVLSVLGREAQVDHASIATPFIRVYRATDLTITDATLTTVTGWTVSNSVGITHAGSGWIQVDRDGVYLVLANTAWQANTAGSRYIQIQVKDTAGAVTTWKQNAISAATAATLTVSASTALSLKAGEQVSIQVQQTSGALLNLVGASDGRNTGMEVVKVATA